MKKECTDWAAIVEIIMIALLIVLFAGDPDLMDAIMSNINCK